MEDIISTLADWTSEMIRWYARQVFLDPSVVVGMRFYNPVSLEASYGCVGGGSSSCGMGK
mgnify:CR=1 FL=1